MSDRKADLRKALKSLYDDLFEAENGPDRNTFGFKHRLEVIHEELEEMMPRLLAEFPHLGEFSILGDFEQEHYRRGDSGMDQLLKSTIKKLAIETDTDLEYGIEQIKLKEIESDEESTNHNNKQSSSKTNDKLLKLENEIKIAKLEAERRKAVVESKTYGAQIEIITALRNELKRKDETTKEIQEIKSRLERIERLFSNPYEQLVENVYRPLYDQMMGIYQSRNFITFIPDNPWGQISPSWKLKTEDDIKQLCESYSKELAIWHEMWIDFGNKLMSNHDKLGNLLNPVFEKHGLLDQSGKVKYSNYSHYPKEWLHSIQNVIFNDKIQNGEELYRTFKDETRRRYGEEYSQYLDEWHNNKSELFTELSKMIPDLVKALDAKHSYAEIDKQREILKESIEKLTLALAEKLK